MSLHTICPEPEEALPQCSASTIIHPSAHTIRRTDKESRKRERQRRAAERILRSSGLGFNFLDRPALGLGLRERGEGEGRRQRTERDTER